eukprot:1721927-Pleurochrysis_carterae.AAC.1
MNRTCSVRRRAPCVLFQAVSAAAACDPPRPVDVKVVLSYLTACARNGEVVAARGVAAAYADALRPYGAGTRRHVLNAVARSGNLQAQNARVAVPRAR